MKHQFDASSSARVQFRQLAPGDLFTTGGESLFMKVAFNQTVHACDVTNGIITNWPANDMVDRVFHLPLIWGIDRK